MTKNWMIYGANGYTGELVARLAAARGMRPVLAGRNAEKVQALADELGLQARVFALDDPATVQANLRGMAVVLHCAGPFSRTAGPMVDACLHTGAHYLDITGELPVFEALLALDAKARSAGVMLLPGVGQDVVPTDCLAVHLARRLPGASHLALAVLARTSLSRGTALTIVAGGLRSGFVARNGGLVPVAPFWRARRVDFGRKVATALTVPLGELCASRHSTGIGNVDVYVAVPEAMATVSPLLRHLLPAVDNRPVRRWLQRHIAATRTGPDAEARRTGWGVVWGEVTDDHGGRAEARLHLPEAYGLTAEAAVEIAARVLAGGAKPGYQTPGTAFGPDFVLALPGVRREDVA